MKIKKIKYAKSTREKLRRFLDKIIKTNLFIIVTFITCILSLVLVIFPCIYTHNGDKYGISIPLLYSRSYIDFVLLTLVILHILDSELNAESLKYYNRSKSLLVTLISSLIATFASIITAIIGTLEVSKSLITVTMIIASAGELIVIIYLGSYVYSWFNTGKSEVNISLLQQTSNDVMEPAVV
ncbi:hypothetical protein cand_035880 [Cryptosporidium andersoni]|uniref:Uncharacterized protein n=1 Tax=Cryptosporidium andersoni TaxID=117008 RepID=A0A1J4MV73_9CRYT|nr:hypothetical protein cand_035880 [Cryptosporidium andersoni]